MKIGYMNSPFRGLPEEIKFASQNGFDYLELTIEPPRAARDEIEIAPARALLKKLRLPVPVGHNAWYVPFASPIEDIRRAGLSYFEKCLPVYLAFGIRKVSIHTNFFYSGKVTREILAHHVEFFRRIVRKGEEAGVKIMMEPVGTEFDTLENLSHIFRRVPALSLHLDIGHANITQGDGGIALLRRFGSRLLHVHVSDNNGREDQHLPLGCGKLDLLPVLRELVKIGYNGTITPEVFVRDRDYQLLSRDKLRKLWNRARRG
jgi:sugar phosphate isomerase/epimerase